MLFSDYPLGFKKELIDDLYQALKDIALSGAVVKVSKGDFSSSYRSMEEIQDAIRRLENEIEIDESDFMCDRRIC